MKIDFYFLLLLLWLPLLYMLPLEIIHGAFNYIDSIFFFSLLSHFIRNPKIQFVFIIFEFERN